MVKKERNKQKAEEIDYPNKIAKLGYQLKAGQEK